MMDLLAPFWITVELIVLLFTLLTIHLYRHFTKLRRLGIPGPTPLPLVGNLLEQFVRGIDQTDKEWLQKYGTVFGLYSGYRPVVVVTDPEVVKAVLVKDFHNFTNRPQSGNLPRLLLNGLFFMRGRTWKKTRNIITPTFSAGKLKILVPILNKCADTLASNLSENAGKDVEIKKFFSHFTMDAIASTAFGIDIDSQKQPDDPFVKNIDLIFKFSPWRRIPLLITAAIPCLGNFFYNIGLTTWPLKSVEFYEQTGQALIDERRKNKMSKIDFLQLLINAEFSESKQEYIHNGMTVSDSVGNGDSSHTPSKLTDEEINGQAFVFFLAGFETTASFLRYAAYELALHPDIDDKLYEEIQKNIGEDTPTYESVASLKYMDQFVNEVLRFYPPVPRLTRETKEEIHYGDITIPAGAQVHVPVWNIHRNPEYYTDPDTFDPDRFSDDRKGNLEGITFLSFGTGPRHCIGMRLALVEVKIALVFMLRRIKFVKSEKTQVPLDLSHFGVLRPKTPVVVRLENR